MARVAPLSPPYEPETAEALHRWMPPGTAHDPLVLFRVLHRNPELASRMRVLGAGLLAHGRLPAADRELAIARTCALNGCDYEWGVHAATFYEQAGLTPDQITATVTGTPGPWSPKQRALIEAVNELHDSATLSQGRWDALAEHYDDAQLLELIVLTGWYRTISQLANSLDLANEPWAAPYPGGSTGPGNRRDGRNPPLSGRGPAA